MRGALRESCTIVLLVGCSGSDGGKTPGTPDTDPEVVTTLEVSCAQPGANVLRWSCTVTVDPAQPATITYTPTGGGAPKTLELPESTGTHVVPLRFVRALTEYGVTATAGGV